MWWFWDTSGYRFGDFLFFDLRCLSLWSFSWARSGFETSHQALTAVAQEQSFFLSWVWQVTEQNCQAAYPALVAKELKAAYQLEARAFLIFLLGMILSFGAKKPWLTSLVLVVSAPCCFWVSWLWNVGLQSFDQSWVFWNCQVDTLRATTGYPCFLGIRGIVPTCLRHLLELAWCKNAYHHVLRINLLLLSMWDYPVNGTQSWGQKILSETDFVLERINKDIYIIPNGSKQSTFTQSDGTSSEVRVVEQKPQRIMNHVVLDPDPILVMFTDWSRLTGLVGSLRVDVISTAWIKSDWRIGQVWLE